MKKIVFILFCIITGYSFKQNDNPEAVKAYQIGYNFYKENNFEYALLYANLAIVKDSNYSEGYFLRALANRRINKDSCKLMLYDINKAIKLDPKNPEAYLLKESLIDWCASPRLMGEKAFESDNPYRDALNLINKAIELDSNYIEAYNVRGDLIQGSCNLLLYASDTLEEIKTVNGLGFKRHKYKMPDSIFYKTTKDYNKVVKLDPNNFHALVNLYKIKMIYGDTIGACSDAMKAKAIDDSFWDYRIESICK
jgi:tetratricopeptide (TPR) repeat protein